MYYRGSFFFRALAALMLVGFLVLGAALIFQAGRATGYSLGQVSGGSEVLLPGVQPVDMQYAPYPFMLFLGLLCFGGLSLLFFFAMAGFFRRKHWKSHGMHRHPEGWDEAYAERWGTPPWWRQPRPDEPSAGSGDAPGAQYSSGDPQVEST